MTFVHRTVISIGSLLFIRALGIRPVQPGGQNGQEEQKMRSIAGVYFLLCRVALVSITENRIPMLDKVRQRNEDDLLMAERSRLAWAVATLDQLINLLERHGELKASNLLHALRANGRNYSTELEAAILGVPDDALLAAMRIAEDGGG